MVKNMPAMQDIQVQSLGWEDPLEKELAIHSSILTQRILWTEEPGGLQSIGSQGHDWATNTSLHFKQTQMALFYTEQPFYFFTFLTWLEPLLVPLPYSLVIP